MIKFIDSPVPIIIGINQDISYYKSLNLEVDNDLIIIDLDNNSFEMNAKIML